MQSASLELKEYPLVLNRVIDEYKKQLTVLDVPSFVLQTLIYPTNFVLAGSVAIFHIIQLVDFS